MLIVACFHSSVRSSRHYPSGCASDVLKRPSWRNLNKWAPRTKPKRKHLNDFIQHKHLQATRKPVKALQTTLCKVERHDTPTNTALCSLDLSRSFQETRQKNWADKETKRKMDSQHDSVTTVLSDSLGICFSLKGEQQLWHLQNQMKPNTNVTVVLMSPVYFVMMSGLWNVIYLNHLCFGNYLTTKTSDYTCVPVQDAHW